jgi:hypothetical protein
VTEPSPDLVCDTSDYYLEVCDQKSELALDIDHRSCQRKWSTKTKTEYHSDITKKRRVIPREDPEENWFHVSEICNNNVDNFCLIHFYLDNLLKISRSISIDVPEVFGQDPHEEVSVCCKDVPRNDCFAILSNGCITAPMSESSPKVETDPSQQPANMGEVKELHLKEIKAYYWVTERIWDPGIVNIKMRQT